jgi:hypothetical protein
MLSLWSENMIDVMTLYEVVEVRCCVRERNWDSWGDVQDWFIVRQRGSQGKGRRFWKRGPPDNPSEPMKVKLRA